MGARHPRQCENCLHADRSLAECRCCQSEEWAPAAAVGCISVTRPTSSPAPILAACRVARDTAFATSGALASFLSRYQGDQSLAIVLNPTNSTDNVFETYLPGNSDGLRQTAKEFALHSASASARGMTVSATHAYVVDDSTERVNVYQLSDGARQTGSEFAIHSSNTWPVGIAVNATDAYVADNANNKLFVYQLSDGARQTAKEFALHSDNFRPSGVAVDATYAYVVDLDDHKLYVYQLSDGARQAGRGFDFDTDNTNPQGIAVDATYAYVVDQADGKLYVYRLSDGTRIKGQEFGLDPANANARGIGVTAAFAYVVDFDDRTGVRLPALWLLRHYQMACAHRCSAGQPRH